jgi:ribosomal protein S1
MATAGTGLAERLQQAFPGYLASPREAWDEAKAAYPLGAQVSGRVVQREHFGVFIDIGVGFPALLLCVHFADDAARGLPDDYPPVGTDVAGRVYVHNDRDRQIGLTQKARETWMDGNW